MAMVEKFRSKHQRVVAFLPQPNILAVTVLILAPASTSPYPPPPSTTYQPQSEVTVLIIAPVCISTSIHYISTTVRSHHTSLPLALLCPPPLSPTVHYMSTTATSHCTHHSTTLCPPPLSTTYQPQPEVTVLPPGTNLHPPPPSPMAHCTSTPVEANRKGH